MYAVATPSGLYYTGRAGDRWLSDDPADAFGYRSESEARLKAKTFNTYDPAHRFAAVRVTEQTA